MSRAWPVDNLDPEAPLAENARRILAVKMAELYSYAPIVHQADAVEQLHDMRIAAKRLRYSLELFRVVFDEVGELQIERVKALEEALGELHDLDVRIALIEEELRTLAVEQANAAFARFAEASDASLSSAIEDALQESPNDPRRGLLALLARQHAARRRCHRDVVRLWERFQAEGMRADLAALSRQHDVAEQRV